MQVVFAEVGIDTGSGVFMARCSKVGDLSTSQYGTNNRFGANRETYGNTKGKLHRRPLVDYSPNDDERKFEDLHPP